MKIYLLIAAMISFVGFTGATIPDAVLVNHTIDDSLYSKENRMTEKTIKSEEEWKNLLSPKQFHILREKGTERPYTGEYWNTDEAGTYSCAGCGQVLFESDTKFESGCGWPSFYDVSKSDKIVTKDDNSFGMSRTEVLCSNCGGHLGHVFTDGPEPTGLRYCINSAALEFTKD